MSAFAVDVGTLALLRARLIGLQTSFAAIDGRDDIDDASVGDPAGTAALRTFIDGWRDGRASIEANIGRALGLIGTAIASYGETEAALTAAAGGTVGPRADALVGPR